MISTKIKWLFVARLCLALWSVQVLTACARELDKLAEYKPYQQGDYAEAEALFKSSLAILEQIHGPEHLEVTTSLNNLAELYHAQGKYAKAELFFKRSLAIKEKALGPDHPSVAATLENYVALLREVGRTDDADKMEARAKAIRARHAK